VLISARSLDPTPPGCVAKLYQEQDRLLHGTMSFFDAQNFSCKGGFSPERNNREARLEEPPVFAFPLLG
jgi:hypothetical protein